ncbi:riboflavin synthase [Aeromicrobium sp. YIM 150415]|uniref:riboflavin synthase n=1 Tax=Aeromicrobium sp. YIM 150415 TaxID=2803912 RepID=UPI0019654184|nr:riboflavin synthase [Aeromicrobium sp. YIM 150415]MBM9464905.1 riboflavin synthase [Aeromicrobium sp. YIM 150415]
MFTGLIEEVGEVIGVQDQGDAVRLTVRGPVVTDGARHGDSIAVNGVCLTVTDPTADTFTADVMRESLERSSLGDLTGGSRVNLERAMLPTTRFGGHVVQGHVDGTAQLLDRTPSEHWEVLRFALPESLARYLVEKGSITVDGTSLTVVEVADDPEPWFSVSLIPTTLADTTLGALAPGARVNLEVDVLAKYVERLLAKGAVHG